MVSIMRKISALLFFIFFVCTAISQVKPGYEISFTISGLRDSSVYLAYHLGDKQYIRDTVKLDSNGHSLFSGKESLPEGIYMIVLPGKKYFELLISDDQHFSISCTYTDTFNTLVFTGSEINSAFINYQKKWVGMQQRAAEIGKRIQAGRQNSDSLKLLTATQRVQEQNMISYLKSVVTENKGNLLSLLVKAMLPIEPPEFNIPLIAANRDSLKWVMEYNYNKDHYFDNIDLNDERILRTPLLYSRLNTFFTSVVVQSPDSINNEIDRIIKKTGGNHSIFQFVAVYLFNHFRESEIMGHDAVMVKLADDIYLTGRADWVSQEFKADLKKQIDLIRPNLIGLKAQNLVMDSYKGIFVSLYDIESEFTILYFWEPDCGFCKEATPKLKEYFDKVEDNSIEVFSVCTTSDKAKWAQYIEDNKLTTWINGWDPERRTNFSYYFNVQTTPMIYILDRDKTIIAKKLGVDDIAPFLENYRKYNR